MNTNYAEIEKELEKVENETIKRAFYSFTTLCQRFYKFYQINEELAPVKNILKSLMDKNSTYYLTKKGEGVEETEETNSDNIYIEFEHKIYAGIFQRIYDKYYKTPKKFSWEKAVTKDEYINLIISEHLADLPDYIKKEVRDSIKKVYFNSSRRINYDNIANAMDTVKRTLEIPTPSIEESVEDLIAPSMLDTMLMYLKSEPVGFFFTIAPIRRALTDGTYHKYYAGNKSNKDIFFNLNSQYNLLELERYIDTVYDLLERYTLIVSEFENII